MIKDLDQGECVDQVEVLSIKLKKNDHWDNYWQHIPHSRSLLHQTHKELCTAAQNNDLEQLQSLLSPTYRLPIDVNMKLEEQWCSLHYATIEGNYEACKLLLNSGAKPDVTNVQKRTPLHIASIKGFLEICQLLIERGATINVFDYHYNSPLHLASQLGHYEIVTLLLNHEADYNVRNNFNYNAYDLSYDQKVMELFEKKGLFTSYQKKSFIGIHNRNDHIQRLLQLSDRTCTKMSQSKISRVEIQQIGPQDFQVLCQLGKGSFGQVYLVEKKGGSQKYAMKILIKKKIQAAGIVRYAQTERRILSFVTSPFIVKLHYAFQTENKLYMIMDYCPGGDLEQMMNERGKLPEKAARAYACEVLLALETLHQNCIVYRDLKPANVVIDKDGHALLTDFGLSKELQATRTISFCGSYAYLAPEMLEKSGHGYPLDWYLFGVFLYELISGKPPFYERDKNSMFDNIKNADPPRPDEAGDDMWSLLKGLLEKNQSKRLGSHGDASEIKNHPWFKNVNWEQVMLRKQPVPKVTIRTDLSDLDLKVTFSEQAMHEGKHNFIHDWDY